MQDTKSKKIISLYRRTLALVEELIQEYGHKMMYLVKQGKVYYVFESHTSSRVGLETSSSYTPIS